MCFTNSLRNSQLGKFHANGASEISKALKSATIRISLLMPPASASRIISNGVANFSKHSHNPAFSKVFLAG